MRTALVLTSVLLVVHIAKLGQAEPETPAPLRPVVEVEEDVFAIEFAENGASPMWCYGSTCLVRIGEDVFASGLETLKDVKPLNNVRWTLWKRGSNGWELQQADPKDRTREPCPIVGFADGRLFMSVNPTLSQDPDARTGPARPEVLSFSAADTKAQFETLVPDWKDKPSFTEHSYRSFAGDGQRGELVLFQNVGYSHSQWACLDRDGNWSATGKLVWPKRADPKHPPYNSTRARVNYPNVVLDDRAVHLCGAAAFNKWERVQDDPKLMGRQWSNRWRRLYYTWTPDITTGTFNPWVEIASTDKTGGWLFPADMWLAPDGRVHLLWMEFPISKKLRDEHFTDIRLVTSMKYAVVENGQVVGRRTLLEGGEGLSGVLPRCGRFHVTPTDRLVVFYYVDGADSAGEPIRENRLMEVHSDGTLSDPIPVPLKYPLGGFLGFFTATARGGSPTSTTLDLLGYRVYSPDADRTLGKYPQHAISTPNRISYARIRLK